MSTTVPSSGRAAPAAADPAGSSASAGAPDTREAADRKSVV